MFESTKNSELSAAGFTFFTNHARVLLLIALESDVRMRELAMEIGITERAVQRIVEDLVTGGYLAVTKEGRRNHYQIRGSLPMRHPVEAHRNVEQLIDFIFPGLQRPARRGTALPQSERRTPESIQNGVGRRDQPVFASK